MVTAKYPKKTCSYSHKNLFNHKKGSILISMAETGAWTSNACSTSG